MKRKINKIGAYALPLNIALWVLCVLMYACGSGGGSEGGNGSISFDIALANPAITAADVGHQIKRLTHEDGHITEHCMRTIHAEQNAICQAAKQGVSIEGATLYTRMTPCRTCAMLIINCGIQRVVCERKYHAGKESEQMFKQAGIALEFKYNGFQKY